MENIDAKSEDYSLETKDLIIKKAVQEDWRDMYENLWRHAESAKYMLWNVTTSEEDAISRMERTIDFEKKEKYALIVYENALVEEAFHNCKAKKFVASCRTGNLASHALQIACGFHFSHNEERIDSRTGEKYVLEFYVKEI